MRYPSGPCLAPIAGHGASRGFRELNAPSRGRGVYPGVPALIRRDAPCRVREPAIAPRLRRPPGLPGRNLVRGSSQAWTSRAAVVTRQGVGTSSRPGSIVQS
jgi:hypothetical protein